VIERVKGKGCIARDKVDLIPRTAIDDRNETIAESIVPVRPMVGGPRSSMWPIQSGAAQSPFTGRDRVQATPMPANRVIAPTLAPAVRTGRACVTDSPIHNPSRGPVPTLRFASEARRTRLASCSVAPVLNEEEGATERPYPSPGAATPAPTPVSTVDPVIAEWNRQHREALTEAQEDAARRKALLPKPPAPKRLPRPARQGAPTPRHGIEGAVSSSGRDMDPSRKR
jgi:hypothetical protein